MKNFPLIDFLFPRKCLGCGKPGGYFCSQCLNQVALEPERICPMCGKFSVGGLTHQSCFIPWGLAGLTTVFSYQGIVKKAIKKLKYRFVSDLAEDLVEIFLSFCGEDVTFARLCQEKKIILVPIPLHQSRLKWRGFNQSELLGKIIAENLDLEIQANILKRVKATKSQFELDKKERQKNIFQAFEINSVFKSQTRGSNFLIFDDVWTSGATLREAGKVLKRNKATKVWGLTLAR